MTNGFAALELIDSQTLSVFMSAVLSKKYSHPSSAIITLLAGLDNIDPVFTGFVSTLDGIIRSGVNRTNHDSHDPDELR